MQTIILVLKIGNSKITESLLNRKAVTVLVTHQSYSGLQRFFSRGSTKLKNSGNSRGWGLKQKLSCVRRRDMDIFWDYTMLPTESIQESIQK